jgi:hypothetical protein
MKFQFPEFLFGLLLIAIPVIIHLFNFRKFKKVYFSNTRFLQQIKIQNSGHQKLKDRLILLSRILAVIFLVLAFSKPYFPSNNEINPAQESTVSIYVDNSYSMEAINKDGSLLDEAKRKAKEIAETFPLNTRFQLITNDLSGGQNKLLTKEELSDELLTIQVSAAVNDYSKVIQNQTRFLSKQGETKSYAFLISDFQKYPNEKIDSLDAHIQFNLVSLKPNYLPNVAIDSVWFISPLHQPQTEERLVVRVKNFSDKLVENIAISLKINDQIKTIGGLNLKPNNSATDTLNFSGLNAGWHKGEVLIKDYPVIFDDRLYFSFEVKKSLAITIINQNLGDNSVEAVFKTDPFFETKNIIEKAIDYNDLKNQQLVVLNNLNKVEEGLAQQLNDIVMNGGNLSVFIPLEADLISYQRFLQRMGVDYPVQLKNDSIRTQSLNLNHPFFQNVFMQTPDNMDLPKATSYFELSKLTKTTARVLLKSERNTPLLNIYKIGKGNLYLSALPIDLKVSNFTKHGLFLPILFKMALFTQKSDFLYEKTGSHTGVLIDHLNLAEAEILKIKSEEIEIIPEIRNTNAGTVLYFADQVKKAGFYELFHQDKLLSILAFNDPREESVMEFYSQAELSQQFGIDPSQVINSGTESVKNQIKEVKLGASLWKLCLILVLIFLAIEILLIRFFKAKEIKPANN